MRLPPRHDAAVRVLAGQRTRMPGCAPGQGSST